MRYMGGKTRIGKKIAEVIQSFSPASYDEPFCGVYSVGRHVVCPRRTAGDIHPDLIMMLEAVRDGWIPPTGVTEERYHQLRSEVPSPTRGAVGFGCSFYGKFFGGFARGNYSDFSDLTSRTLLKLAPGLQGVEFRLATYRDYASEADLIYCDPPYAGTTDFSRGEYVPEEFWDWVRGQKGQVLVSEYTAPDDFDVIWSQPGKTTMRDSNDRGIDRVEKLFKWHYSRK